jgi:hypothetical protein
MKSRRQFFNTLIRVGMFASLSLITGALIRRWSEAADCQQNFTCDHCTLSNQCQLAEADNFRLNQASMQKTNIDDGRTGK